MKFTVRTLNLILLGFVCVSPLAAQDKDILPVPESYRVEGVPPIRTSEVSKLFYEQNEIRSNLIWDADKANRRLLVTDETRNIHLLDSPLAKPVKTYGKKRSPTWSASALTAARSCSFRTTKNPIPFNYIYMILRTGPKRKPRF